MTRATTASSFLYILNCECAYVYSQIVNLKTRWIKWCWYRQFLVYFTGETTFCQMTETQVISTHTAQGTVVSISAITTPMWNYRSGLLRVHNVQGIPSWTWSGADKCFSTLLFLSPLDSEFSVVPKWPSVLFEKSKTKLKHMLLVKTEQKHYKFCVLTFKYPPNIAKYTACPYFFFFYIYRGFNFAWSINPVFSWFGF